MTPCIVWTGPLTRDGYGLAECGDLYDDGKRHRSTAHRVAWLRAGRTIPDEQVLHHICHNRPCVNLDHLEPVDKAWHDDHHKRKDTCKRGHDRTNPENVWTDAKGNRHCRPCWPARRQERKEGDCHD